MGKRTVEILECDICGRKTNPDSDTKEWLKFSQDHPVEDRAWIERCICSFCMADIKVAIKNSGV
jgi:hypothetical protein